MITDFSENLSPLLFKLIPVFLDFTKLKSSGRNFNILSIDEYYHTLHVFICESQLVYFSSEKNELQSQCPISK